MVSGWEGWDTVNRFHHNSLMIVVTPTDHPKSVSNRFVIEVLSCVFVLSLDFHFLMVWGFAIGLGQISSFITVHERIHRILLARL